MTQKVYPKVKTIEESLTEIVLGKAKPMTCSGFPIPGSHEIVEYVLHIGIASYDYTCPICGFGQGGSLREEVCNALLDLKRLQTSPAKSKEAEG